MSIADSLELPADIAERTREFLLSLVEISSPSSDLQGLRTLADALVEGFGELALPGQVVLREGAGGSLLPVAQIGAVDADPCLLVLGHMDTVLPAMPPRKEDDRLFATGAIDMKGGLAAFWGALALLRQRQQPPPSDLALIVVPDEEVSGPLSHACVAEWGRRARQLWVIEPGQVQNGAETLVAGRRGMFDWRLIVRGRAAHSGNQFWEGRSALVAAADWSSAAAALASSGEGPTVNVARCVAGDGTFVDDLGRQASLLGTARQLNVVSERAVVEGEARFLKAPEGEALKRRLQDLASEIQTRHEVSAELTFFNQVPPLAPGEAQRQLAKRAVELAAARGWRLEIETDRGGISFPNFLPDPGAVPVLDGLGPIGDGMHTRQEHVLWASLERRIVLLADLMTDGG